MSALSTGKEINNKKTCNTYYMNFKQRIEELPCNRRQETVLLIRELIKDMWNSGHNASSIARAMGKDHTTILHHLWFMDIEPSERVDETNKKKKEARDIIELSELRKRAIALSQIRSVSEALFEEKTRIRKEAKTKLDEERKVALSLWKKGTHYGDIAKVLNTSSSRVQSLLIFCPFYQKHKGTSGYKKQVIQMDKKGQVIKTWDSIREASIKTGVQGTGIVANCKGRNQGAGGFVWEYA